MFIKNKKKKRYIIKHIIFIRTKGTWSRGICIHAQNKHMQKIGIRNNVSEIVYFYCSFRELHSGLHHWGYDELRHGVCHFVQQCDRHS